MGIVNTASKPGLYARTLARESRASAVILCLLAKEARTKPGERLALVVKRHISNPRYRPRPLPAALLVMRRKNSIVVSMSLPAALLVVRRRYSIVVSRPLPCCASQVLDRGAQADAYGATQVLDRGAQAGA